MRRLPRGIFGRKGRPAPQSRPQAARQGSRIERFMGYASKAEMLRIDMALLVSLALNVLSGNRSE